MVVAERALQRRRFVAVAREHDGAAVAQRRGDARGRLELRGERGPKRRRGDAELEQTPSRLAELDLGDRREHAGRHARRAGAETLAFEQRHIEPARRRAPRDRAADRSAADDDHIAAIHRSHAGTLARVTRHAKLSRARLYLVGDGPTLERVLDGAVEGGVEIVQLRWKDASPEQLEQLGARLRARCAELGVLFIVNDDAALAARLDADGVHVGQQDMELARAREIVGSERIVGLSTHTPAQIDACAGADYIGVGPVHGTPTKPGRPAVGLELVQYAAAHAPVPFFAIGGIDEHNVAAVRRAGAQRIAVVRAIGDAADPASAARALLGAEPRRRKPRPAPAERSRSAARDDALRAALLPLAPGERPRALLAAVALTGLLGLTNLIAFLLGAKLDGRHPGVGLLAFTALMWLLAGGMLARRYLAVLAFEALLVLIVLAFSLFLVESSNVEALVVCIAAILLAGSLFWKLVRVMSRLALAREQ